MKRRKVILEKYPIWIAHISDFHVGSVHFVTNLMNRCIKEINELDPDIVVITGDLTNEGFRQEYNTAKAYLSNIQCERVIIVPGNHDSRNVGYLHFGELFGDRFSVLSYKGLTIVGADSSEPDLNDGRIGRERYNWILKAFERENDFKIFALHHHLLPVPGTGRERNIIYDAGDLSELLIYAGVHVVLTGHKHVPYVWELEGMYVVNAGTASSLRLRGNTKPCYNLIEINEDLITIYRKYPFGGMDVIARFTPDMHEVQRELSGVVKEIIGFELR